MTYQMVPTNFLQMKQIMIKINGIPTGIAFAGCKIVNNKKGDLNDV